MVGAVVLGATNVVACQNSERDARIVEELVADDAGSRKRWARCPPAVELRIPEKLAIPLLESITAAVTSWASFGPSVTWVRAGGLGEVVREDGTSSVTFANPGFHCRQVRATSPGDLCLDSGMEGVTKLYTRPLARNLEEIVEADVVLAAALLEDPEQLYEVMLHEMGHVLGLRHPKQWSESADTVMFPDGSSGSRGIGRLDRLAIDRLYGSCEGA